MILRLLLLFIYLHPFSVFAQNHQRLLVHTAAIDFTPQEAYLIIKTVDGKFISYKALMSPIENGASEWIVGAYIEEPLNNPPQSFNLLFKGNDNELFYTQSVNIDSINEADYKMSVESMKRHIQKRKDELNTWIVQNKAQAENLRRLRADAEVIADLARIVEINEEIDFIKYEVESIDRDIETLKGDFSLVKTMKQPVNYMRRELDLTKNYSEILDQVKLTEGNEQARRSQSQDEIQRKLRLVELTRFDDEEQLRQELINIKKSRENSTGSIREEKVKNYWEIQ